MKLQPLIEKLFDGITDYIKKNTTYLWETEDETHVFKPQIEIEEILYDCLVQITFENGFASVDTRFEATTENSEKVNDPKFLLAMIQLDILLSNYYSN